MGVSGALVFHKYILFSVCFKVTLQKVGTYLYSTVDSAYLQVVFVRENIAIKGLARLPENSIQTGSLSELQMQTIVSFY